jgi:phosphoribosylformimino-5-aminoimidazole carboxamide ribotide isomerase
MILFPAIDLKDGNCVRLTQGDFNRSTTYNTSPVDQAKIFESAGVEWLHCVDLDGALDGESKNLKAIEDISKNTKLKIQCGGGIRTISQIKYLLKAGILNVILGTAAFDDFELFKNAISKYPNKISLALDIKNNLIATKGWVEEREINLDKFFESINHLEINSIICTDIMRDGMKQGVNTEMLEEVMSKTKIPCVASGGISSLKDLEFLKSQNYQSLKGVITGKAIYDGAFSLKDALEIMSK